MKTLSLKCQVPIIMAASAFGYFFASKSHHYWYKSCDELDSQNKKTNSSPQKLDTIDEESPLDSTQTNKEINEKTYQYINTGIGCIGALISSKVVYDIL